MGKVLVIEDDQMLNRVYALKFAAEKIDVEFTVDAEEGFKKVKALKPSLVILDLILPPRGGFEVLEKMQKSKELSIIPVVVVTGLGQATDKQRCLALGAKEYIIKTQTPLAEIVEKIKALLK